MNKLIAATYRLTPRAILNLMKGKNRFRWLKDTLLRSDGKLKIMEGDVSRSYGNQPVRFKFCAPLQIVVKAQKKGIENTLLNNSFKLLNKYKEGNRDLEILDIGANYGYLSLVWAKALKEMGVRVSSFEPSPNVSEVTKKNFTINDLANVTLYCKAMGKEKGTVKLYDASSTSNVIEIENTDAVSVEMTTIDDFVSNENLNKLDLIKIDVDGIEFDILNGGINSLRKFKPIFIVETNDDIRIVNFFRDHDYMILDMELNQYTDQGEIPCNIFCVPVNGLIK